MLELWKRPQHYYGADWSGWLVAPVACHRDSDTVTRSNWRVFLSQMDRAPDEDKSLAVFEDEAPYHIVKENHFLVGWVEWIAIHPLAAVHVRIAEDAARRLEEYPILDEDDWSELEHEEENQ
jgi:hypothetical protein